MREGISAAEAALAWAGVAFGASEELFEGLEGPSRQATRRVWREAMKLTDQERVERLDAWARADVCAQAPDALIRGLDTSQLAFWRAQLSPRWRAVADRPDAVAACVAKIATAELMRERPVGRRDLVDPRGFDVAQLWELDEEALSEVFTRFGAAQVAASWQGLDRRQTTRLLQGMEGEVRAWVERALRTQREVTPEERVRLREVVAGVSRRAESLREVAERVGIFFVAVAAGRRHAPRVEVLARRLSGARARALRAAVAQTRRSTRQRVEAPTRRALADVMDQRDEMEPTS